MLVELAQICCILALCIAFAQGTITLFAAQKGHNAVLPIAKPAAHLQLGLVAIAYAILTYSFIIHDFSVAYVASNSNTEQPLIYRISGVWGAHEGSLLLWILIQSIWSSLVAVFSRRIPDAIISRVLGVLGLVNVGFLSFMLFTSNPFDRMLPAPLQGRELNPLLQDPGLAIHPPMLYIGYVGFSVAFAFSIAALLSGKLDAQWARWARPWTNAAWLFLTIGITLGSWWAYYELGWGGWWFWDPVENASFMPWLVGTALIHSLAVTEKRGAFIAWTVLLAIFSFSLSLLGTFLVRSGILTSVHAFASDPERGIFILFFLLFVIGGSLTLYAARAHKIRSSVGFSIVSKESSLLLNNVFLIVTAFMVLLGTLFPLLLEGLGQGKISVGAPYFDVMFAILMLPLALLVGLGAMTRWKKDQLSRFANIPLVLAIISLIAAAALTGYLSSTTGSDFSIGTMAGAAIAFWVVCWTVYGFMQRAKNQNGLRKLKQPAAFWGMSIAHLGIAVFILGVAHVNTYSLEKDVSMSPGDSYALGRYNFEFADIRNTKEYNYLANEGRFIVTYGDRQVTELKPQKRYYSSGGNPMTEAAIDTTLTRDLYISLGEPIDNKLQGRWSVRLYYKSYVAWIWLGGFIMALGGLIACFDRRYRKKEVVA